MIFLRALPFSLSVFWRMLIVFPAIIIASLAIGFLAGLIGVPLYFLAPLPIVAFFGTIVMFAMTIMPILVGLRVGLVTRGIKPLCSYLSLVKPMLGYGLILGFVIALLIAGSLGLFVWQAGFTMEDYSAFQDPRQQGVILSKLNEATNTGILIAVGVGFLMCSFIASLLMPLAGASVGRDTNGHRHTPFFGFGQGFAGLLLLVALSGVISTFTPDILVGAANLIGQDEFIRSAMQVEGYMLNGELAPNWKLKYGVLIGLSSIVGLYTMSLFCAGAALTYTDNTDNDDQAPVVSVDAAPRLSTEEVRSLWKDRMPDIKAS